MLLKRIQRQTIGSKLSKSHINRFAVSETILLGGAALKTSKQSMQILYNIINDYAVLSRSASAIEDIVSEYSTFLAEGVFEASKGVL